MGQKLTLGVKSSYVQQGTHGFTIVEVVVVVVILGLLIGSAVTGKSMLKAARLDSVITDVELYHGAVVKFKNKFSGLPGDLINATSYWGFANPDAILCETTDSGGKATCNGDGDGLIGYSYVGTNNAYERHRFWQHLANSGFIDGSFSGVAGNSGPGHSVLGDHPNSAKSRIQNAGFSVISGGPIMQDLSGHHSFFDGRFGTRFFFGAQADAMASALWGAAITGTQALDIDTKMDDGKPATGKAQSYKKGAAWGTPNCTTAADATAMYDVTTGDINNCALTFVLPENVAQ